MSRSLNFARKEIKNCMHLRYLSKDKLRILMKTFIESQFNYCPLVWMFHNRKINNKINRLHERALGIVYNDDKLSFQELLDRDGTVKIHEEICKDLLLKCMTGMT